MQYSEPFTENGAVWSLFVWSGLFHRRQTNVLVYCYCGDTFSLHGAWLIVRLLSMLAATENWNPCRSALSYQCIEPSALDASCFMVSVEWTSVQRVTRAAAAVMQPVGSREGHSLTLSLSLDRCKWAVTSLRGRWCNKVTQAASAAAAASPIPWC